MGAQNDEEERDPLSECSNISYSASYH